MVTGYTQAGADAEFGQTLTSGRTTVLFSSLTGASDDAKLTTFLSYAAAQTYKGITLILDEPRNYSFATKRTLFSGLSIMGPPRPQDQARSGTPIGNKITLSTTGGWFQMPASNVFSVSFQNLSFDGGSGTRLIDGHASSVLWTSVFRDISSQNQQNILGSTATALLVTAVTVDGWWNVNNIFETAFHISGSDFFFKPSMFLLDSDPSSISMPVGEYLARWDYMEKLWISNIYCTAEQHSGFLLDGSTNTEASYISDCLVEGRNASQPCYGAVIRMTGGTWSIKDSWVGYGMSGGTNGRTDLGMIHQTAGNLVLDNITYKRATGVAETVPVLYVASGAKARVRNVRGLGFTGLPYVRQAVSGGIDADNSVNVTTG